MTAPDAITDITEFLSTLYRTTPGFVCMCLGCGGYFDAKNKYKHTSFTETWFTWPDEKDQAAREILRARELGDVYIGTCVYRTRHRRAGNALAYNTIHVDVDGALDLAKVAEFDGAYVIESGSPGHCHAYFPLAAGVTAAEFGVLERAARRYFGGDNKVSDADVLRPPGTLNYKSAARGGEPTPAVWPMHPSGARLDDLAARLGVDRSPAAANGEAKPVDLDAYPQVQAALADSVLKDDGSVDRSATTMKVVGACVGASLTLDQTRWVVNTRADLAERLQGRPDDDVARCWTAAVNSRYERAQQRAAEEALFGSDGASAASAVFAATEIKSNFDGDPIPLIPAVVEVPAFPVDAFPDTIAAMITELAEFTQTDPAMAGMSALTVLGACAGGHAKIQVRRGWREPLCLYTNTIARPAERKSAVQETMAAPLHDAEAELSFAGELERLALADDLDMAKRKVDQLNKAAVNAAAKAGRPGATADDRKASEAAAEAARDAKAAMREIQVPVIPRLLADDVTPEAVASLLADHRGRIAIISTEGGIFDTIAGRYAKKVNLDVFLKGHSGDRIMVDRQGRGPQHIPSPALTLGLMVQPRVIEAIAANREFVGRGLLARFLYATPVSKVGSRVSDTSPVQEITETQYRSWIKKLASDMAGWAGDPAVLTLSDEAEIRAHRLQEEVEATLADDGELAYPPALTEWGGKYVGAVMRIAGLLHLAEHGEGGHCYPVQPETIEAAQQIGAYLKATAINVFSRMGADLDTADAVYLLRRVAQLDSDEVSERDMFTNCSRSRFPTKSDMLPSLRRLIVHGYLLPLPTPKPTGGRPASPIFKVHPIAAQAAKHAKGWL